MQTAQQTINQIDALIDGNRRSLMSRLHFNPDCSSRAWQTAWDRCPDLRARENQLYSQRYDAQVSRDKEINAAHKAEQRKNRTVERKAAARIECHTCHAFTLAA